MRREHRWAVYAVRFRSFRPGGTSGTAFMEAACAEDAKRRYEELHPGTVAEGAELVNPSRTGWD